MSLIKNLRFSGDFFMSWVDIVWMYVYNMS